MNKKYGVFWIGILLTISTISCAQSYDRKLEQLYRNTVAIVQPDTLQSWIDRGPITLLDTRQEEEFLVSHLPGAFFVDYDDFAPEKVADLPKDQPIVVYCTVGYRSERIGEQLQALGFQEVYNLYGGIVQWKNEGHVVIDQAGEQTEEVHTYNKRWGKWLIQGVKVY